MKNIYNDKFDNIIKIPYNYSLNLLFYKEYCAKKD